MLYHLLTSQLIYIQIKSCSSDIMVLICAIIVLKKIYCLLPVITVNFSEMAYSVNEDDGPAQPVLVLSNPSSTDITVQVRDTENTATSE